MEDIFQHRDAYKKALKTQDSSAMLKEKVWLTAAAAAALLEQDAEAMRGVKACCADLSALADRFDETGKPGDRWRTLGDMLSLALESGKPLQQLRLVLPSTVSGLIMTHINKKPGITPTELTERCLKSKTHIANEIKKLESAGLIHSFKRGTNKELFLSILGKAALDSLSPSNLVTRPSTNWEYKHMDPEREQKLRNIDKKSFFFPEQVVA